MNRAFNITPKSFIISLLLSSIFITTAAFCDTVTETGVNSKIERCKQELIDNKYNKSYKDCIRACNNPDLTTSCGLGKNPKETAQQCSALCCGMTPDCPKIDSQASENLY